MTTLEKVLQILLIAFDIFLCLICAVGAVMNFSDNGWATTLQIFAAIMWGSSAFFNFLNYRNRTRRQGDP